MIPMLELLNWLREREPAIVRLLGRMVNIESPSHDKAAVDRFGAMIDTEWKRRGARVRLLRQRKFGNHVRAEICLGHGRPNGQLLVLGHLDTVYPVGTLAKTPFHIAGGRAWGPGTFDMKGGHAIALFAVDALRALCIPTRKKITFLWTSDEEIGSTTSRRAIESAARQS
ncbi:MAG: M20/M25/M40 family metallo-hydrolase, partial [Candidatus Acidiferrales bacterium]